MKNGELYAGDNKVTVESVPNVRDMYILESGNYVVKSEILLDKSFKRVK